MGKRLGICDIAYYGKRVTVFEEPRIVKDDNGKIRRIPQASHYEIRKLQAEKVMIYHEGTDQKNKITAVVPIKKIYSKIKHVYDFDGVLIARRHALGQPLQITGKGMSKFLRYG